MVERNVMIHHFFECYVPTTACNLKCDYCYIRQEYRNKGKIPVPKYSADYIGQKLSPKRLGGICLFSICAGGETLLSKELIDIVHELVQLGHYVSITTNGTVTASFNKICHAIPPEQLSHLNFFFSLHYIELKKHGLLDVFASNYHKVLNAGCSVGISLTMYDGYEPYFDEIKNYCISSFKCLPQVDVARKEASGWTGKHSFYTDYSASDYYRLGKSFNSPLWDFTYMNFMVKRREFCYAGLWTSWLMLYTGELRKCYDCADCINIYDNDDIIRFEPVGKHCQVQYCFNSRFFLALGCIPSLAKDQTISSLRFRLPEQITSNEMRSVLSTKMNEYLPLYSFSKRILYEMGYYNKKIISRIARTLKQY